MTDEITAPSPLELAKALAELGEPVGIDDASELLQRLERQHVSDLYWNALHTSVCIKANREKRRELRRDMQPKRRMHAQ